MVAHRPDPGPRVRRISGSNIRFICTSDTGRVSTDESMQKVTGTLAARLAGDRANAWVV
jgi:hypothetical protein